MNDYVKQLEVAKQAAQRLAEIRQLERQAAALPELQSKVDLQRRQKDAGLSLSEAERRARQTLEDAKPVIQDARRRFENGLSECLAALNDLGPTQDEIEAAASKLWNALATTTTLSASNGDGGFWGNPSMGVSAATVNAQFSRHWQQIGGNSPDLDFLDREPDRVALAILRAAQFRAYSTGPNGGAKLFFKYR